MIDPSTNELVVSLAGAEFRPKESSGRRKLTSGTKTILVVRVVASSKWCIKRTDHAPRNVYIKLD